MYNIRNGAIRLLISTLKVVLEHFSITLNVFQILNIIGFSEISVTLYNSRSRYTAFIIAQIDGKNLTSYMMAIVMLSYLSSFAIIKYLQFLS